MIKSIQLLSHKLTAIKILGRCCRCGKVIDLYWNENLEVDGLFMCEDSYFSALWRRWLPRINKIVCNECWTIHPERKLK